MDRNESAFLLFSILAICGSSLAFSSFDQGHMRHFNVGVLLVSGTGSGFDLEKTLPAVDMALEFVNRVYLHHHKVHLNKVTLSYSSCDNRVTPGLASDLKFISNVIAFIGPACGFALEPVARLSAYWDIPIVTGLGDQPPSTESEIDGENDKLLARGYKNLKFNGTGVFGDKSEFPTLTRLSYCQCRLNRVFDSICRRFGWRRHLAVVYDKTDLFSFTVGRILINGLKDLQYEVYGHDIDGRDLSELDEALEQIQIHARIVILSLQESLVRQFMLKAHHRKFTSGDWAFLDVELFKNKPSETNFWEQGEADDLEVKAAYESLLTISLLVPKSGSWNSFAAEVKERALRDYDFSFPEDEEVNFFIGAFYDGVRLLGMALNETLTENDSLAEGRKITLRMWNRTFQGVTGNVTIDSNGDRDADYSILDLNPATGHFEVVAQYYSQRGLIEVKEIRWPGNSGPPPDTPTCGFLGNDPKCQEERPMLLPYFAVFLIAFSFLILLVVFFVYKWMKEAEESNKSRTRWRVLPEELTFDVKSGIDESSRGSVSHGTGGVGGVIPTFVPTAIYKGNQVGLKRIRLFKKTEFTRQIIDEIRQIKDVEHENVARFVGLCLTTSDQKTYSDKFDDILILQEYCSRGSLRNVLLNANIHLDATFRLSLISDIVHGMTFIHSNIGVHGCLRSTKCLVDARFIVKVADFGLHSLNSMRKKDFIEEDEILKLFWVPPEHLNRNGNEGSIKGDVYAFGMILFEVVTRSRPFSAITNLSPQDIVEKVSACLIPPFRPDIEDESVPDEILKLIRSCWDDNPDDRPDFSTIKQTLKKLMKGTGLVDDLLRRLEQHASHLEGLVEDKTRELEQEKRKSEDLLYQVLPREVAGQLLKGKTVIPESFDAVTIYFSDIVGFTSLCAKSTPIQVVDFLNNLYGIFDGILDSFDAYKVETIGDAYMVVSGAPQRNGDSHVSEIALLSLAVLEAVKNYEIGHLPYEQLKIRIGIHTGSICAGVVGQKMPRYCLFGDTVNVASRMESTSLPLKIHVSEMAARALNEIGGFALTIRGEVELKGKGATRTYWLEGSSDESLWRREKLKSSEGIHIRLGSSQGITNGYSVSIPEHEGSSPSIFFSPRNHNSHLDDFSIEILKI